MVKTWTDDDKALLFSDMSNKEIAEKVHRSVKAVESRRYKLTGHYVETEKQKPPELTPRRPVMDDTYKKARIIALAQKLGVKLYG